MSHEELIAIWNDLVRIYGGSLPDYDNCPGEFSYLLKLYMYERQLNESNQNQ
jgi:hypothetical protein